MQTIMPGLVAQYKSDKYPFACDAYDPVSDVYFEYNGTWTHGGRPFDPNSTEDIAKVEAWKSKNTEFYDNAVETWTVRDPKKRETARANGLTLVEFWNYSDVEKYFNLSFKIKDVEDSDSETFS